MVQDPIFDHFAGVFSPTEWQTLKKLQYKKRDVLCASCVTLAAFGCSLTLQANH
jgi:hypothetical protein